jgi:hypothetical protein
MSRERAFFTIYHVQDLPNKYRQNTSALRSINVLQFARCTRFIYNVAAVTFRGRCLATFFPFDARGLYGVVPDEAHGQRKLQPW